MICSKFTLVSDSAIKMHRTMLCRALGHVILDLPPNLDNILVFKNLFSSIQKRKVCTLHILIVSNLSLNNIKIIIVTKNQNIDHHSPSSVKSRHIFDAIFHFRRSGDHVWPYKCNLMINNKSFDMLLSFEYCFKFLKSLLVIIFIPETSPQWNFPYKIFEKNKMAEIKNFEKQSCAR